MLAFAISATSAILLVSKIIKKSPAIFQKIILGTTFCFAVVYTFMRILGDSTNYPINIYVTIVIYAVFILMLFFFWLRFYNKSSFSKSFLLMLMAGLLWSVAYGGGAFLVLKSNNVKKINFSDKKKEIAGLYRATGQKVAIIGIDGATWKIINPLIEQGLLPNFKSLIDQGAHGILKTVVPTSSPLIWTSVATGVTPEEHNIWKFTITSLPGAKKGAHPNFPPKMGSNGFRRFLSMFGIKESPLASYHRKRPALWDILSVANRPTAVVNWWNSYPTYRIDGIMVSDRLFWYGAKDITQMNHPQLKESKTFNRTEDLVFPAEAAETFIKFDRSPMSLTYRDYSRFMNISEKEAHQMALTPHAKHLLQSEFKYSYAMDETYLDVSRRILEKQPDSFDLLMFYFRGVDIISHCALKYSDLIDNSEADKTEKEKFKDVIKNYYIYTDQLLGSLLEKIPEDYNIIVLSDHGFEKQGFNFWGHDHAPDGIIIMKGPLIKPQTEIKDYSVYDITSTCLYMLGYPVAEDFKGRIIKDAINNDWLMANPITKINTYGIIDLSNLAEAAHGKMKGVDKDMVDQLRALGYIQ